jgi:cation:H+ antiporter
VGLALLLAGGEAMVRGASSLARSLGVSHLAVGLTVVALGTSAPELAVNLEAAASDRTALSFGNVLGSNLANVGLVLACCALLRPLAVRRGVATRTIPVLLLATAVLTVMAFDGPSGDDRVDRADGLALLGLLALFLFFLAADLRRRRTRQPSPDPAAPGRRPMLAEVGLAGLGLALLAAGAHLTVAGSVSVAGDLGVPQELVGLTLVAVGTSLPELATSLVATWRGHVDLGVGNVVGSNIFNILLVCGAAATTRSIPVPARGHADLGVNALLTLALWAMARRGGRRITRRDGLALLAVYTGYIAWRAATA